MPFMFAPPNAYVLAKLMCLSLHLPLLFTSLLSCGQNTEATKKRIAEILKQIISIQIQVEKNPELKKNPQTQQKFNSLKQQGDTLIKELSGGDTLKEYDLMLEVTREYLPEHVDEIENYITYKKSSALGFSYVALKIHWNCSKLKTTAILLQKKVLSFLLNQKIERLTSMVVRKCSEIPGTTLLSTVS